MPVGDQRGLHRRAGRRARSSAVALLVVAVLFGGGAVVAWRSGLLAGGGTGQVTAAGTAPVTAVGVPPPIGLHLPPARAAGPVLTAPHGPSPDAAAVRARLAALVNTPRLGRTVGVSVYDLTHDRPVLTMGDPRAYQPASTLKLLTCAATLEALGPGHRFTTSVALTPAAHRPPTVVLVGGGDPLLARRPPARKARGYPRVATLSALGRQTVRGLRAAGLSRVRVGYDDSLFVGPAVSPSWEPSYASDGVVTPISALWVNEGVSPATGSRAADPAAAAAGQFARALRGRGLHVVGSPRRTLTATEHGLTSLGAVHSPPLDEVVSYVLTYSDNEGAEVLLRQLAIATDHPASFRGGVAAMRSQLTSLGVDLHGIDVHDGSGLSRHDRVPLSALLSALRLGADPGRPELRTLVTGLPVAGFDGTLLRRFTAPAAAPALGVVRAKTGTLTGVQALAGLLVDRDGVELAFAAVANGVEVGNTLFARAQLDAVAAALAGCGCSSRVPAPGGSG